MSSRCTRRCGGMPRCGDTGVIVVSWSYSAATGSVDTHKRVYRIYRTERLQVRQRPRRKQRVQRGAEPAAASQRPNERWSLDFVHDWLVNGRSLRLLTVHDDYTRECLWIEADTSLSGPHLARVLDFLTELRGRPGSILTDNGPECAGLALERWPHHRQVTHVFITPGKPSQKRPHRKLQRQATR